MSDHINKRITKIEERVQHLERLNTPRQDNPHSIGAQKKPQQHGDSTPRQSALTDDSTSDSSNNSPNSKTNLRPWWIRMWSWKPWKRALSVIVGIAGVGYAIVTYNQWRDLRYNFRTDQRAWMGVDTLTAERPNAKPFRVVIKFPNSGKTPALDVHSFVEIQYVPKDSPAVFHDDEQSTSVRGHDVTVPGSNYYDTREKSITTDEVSDTTKGNIRIWVSGTIWYRDIFGVNHWTQFCQKTGQPNATLSVIVFQAAWDTCPHNEVDNNDK